MSILLSFLLCTSFNFDTAYLSTILKNNKIKLYKNSKCLISIITTVATFFSILTGFFFNQFVIKSYSNIFSGMCLAFIGLYYFINHIKLCEDNNNYDTSYYVEILDKSKEIDTIVKEIDLEKNNYNIKNCIKLSYYLLIDNIVIGFFIGITLIDISLVTFFNFILTLLLLIFFHYTNNSTLYKSRYLINGLLLFMLGIFIIFL